MLLQAPSKPPVKEETTITTTSTQADPLPTSVCLLKLLTNPLILIYLF